MKKILITILGLALWQAGLAQTVVPNTFAAGQPAKAADVNANFQAMAAAIDAVATRVGKLEGQFTAADLQGAVYSGQMIQIGFDAPAGFVTGSFDDGYQGTLTLAAGNTWSFTLTDAGFSGVPGSPVNVHPVSTSTGSGTWTLTGTTLVLTVTASGNPGRVFSFQLNLGGRFGVFTFADAATSTSGGSIHLFVLQRTN